MGQKCSPLAVNGAAVSGRPYVNYGALDEHRPELPREIVTMFTSQDFQAALTLAGHLLFVSKLVGGV